MEIHIKALGHFSSVFYAIALKSLTLCGIVIIATSVRDEMPRTRTEVLARIIFHVTPTCVDTYRCDSHGHRLARLLENLPAPPKYYGVFDVLPIRKVFAKAKKPGVALEKGRDDRFPTRSKQTLGKDFPSATHTILLIGQYNRGSDIVSFPIPENDIESLRDFTHGLIALIFTLYSMY